MVKVMPKGCDGCVHHRWVLRRRYDYCSQVDDGYTNDCPSKLRGLLSWGRREG